VFRAQLKKSVIALCAAGFITSSAFVQAASQDSAGSTRSLSAQLARLEREVKSLKHQVEMQRPSKSKSSRRKAYPLSVTHQTQQMCPVEPALPQQINSQEPNYVPFDTDVPGLAIVSSGPYVSVPIQFSGGHLIINSPSVNTDVQLLGLRKSIIRHLNEQGNRMAPEAYHSHILLSGIIEAQANYTGRGGQASTTDIDVTNMSLDTLILGPSDWILGFVELSFDNTIPAGSFYRLSNSHVYVNKAFITIGNFVKSPFYGSVGQFYVPYGTYASVMVSDTLPKLLARTKARSVLIGAQQQDKNAFYGAAYLFRGDSHAASVSKINNGGLNLGYRFDQCVIKGDVGVGIIANLADSTGMQSVLSGAEQLVHRVPAYNLRGFITVGKSLNLIGEYTGASTSFNVNNMSFNGHGAKPWAADTQVSYSFNVFDSKPSSIGIGYAKTGEALAIGLPIDRYSAVFNTSLLRNTLQSLEFHRDREYAASKQSSVGGIAAAPESGKYDNVVVAQFDYYF
jgi:hypothetical protein